MFSVYSKTCPKRPLKKDQKCFKDQLSLNAGQKYCRMLWEHSAVLSTFIKLTFVYKTFVFSIFEWLLKTGFTIFERKMSKVHSKGDNNVCKSYQQMTLVDKELMKVKVISRRQVTTS